MRSSFRHLTPQLVEPHADRRRSALVLVVAAAVAVAFADSSIVVLALPDLYSRFATSIVGVSWVITSYNVVLAGCAFALIPAIRRVDTGKLTRAGLLLFCVGSVGAAASWSLPALIIFRCLQGAGAAMLLAGALALLSVLCGSRRRGLAVWIAAGTFGAALGPALGGVLTQLFDWRAIFVFQAPIALLALIAATESHSHPPADAGGTRRVAANLALGLLFGALVGALFLAVLLLISAWGLSPIAGAAVLSTLPVAALGAHRPPRRAVHTHRRRGGGGAAGGRAGRARAAAGHQRGVRRGGARPVRGGNGTGRPGADRTRGYARGGARPRRHRDDRRPARRPGAGAGAGRAGALDRPAAGAHNALLGGAKVLLDANIPIRQEVPIVLGLRTALEHAPRGTVPNLAQPFNAQGAATNVGLRQVRDSLVGAVRDALTRSFRRALALCALLAALALGPILLARRWASG